MLYVSTKDRNQTYTAYQALNLQDSAVYGRIVPLCVPAFSALQLKELCGGSFSQIVSEILNKFFPSNVNADDIEICLKKNPLISDALDRKTLLIRLSGKVESKSERLVNDIYELLSGNDTNAPALPRMLIEIGLLFGLYGDLNRCGIREIDVAVCSGAFWGIDSVYYARKMGLPVRMMICGCANEDTLWDLAHKGVLMSYDADAAVIIYAFSSAESERYSRCCQTKEVYKLSEDLLTDFNAPLFTSVVSGDRRQDVVGNIYSIFGRKLTTDAAGAYGALQDYRAIIGENRVTIVFSEEL